MEIVDYRHLKVSDYLDTGKYRRVLIRFHHGLGDAVMFHGTCLRALRARYPGIEFSYETQLGQEEVFGKVDASPNDYDIVFNLKYPCSEWGSIEETKSEKCARVELGIDPRMSEDYSLPVKFASPLVGVHFNSTAVPRMDVPPAFGKMLWDQIQEEGFIPMDTHMRHKNDNRRSLVHAFETRRVDDIPATVGKLAGLISCMRGFAGVPSGNITLAYSLMPARSILYLSSEFPMRRQIHLDCFEMDIRKRYDKALVHDWLSCVRGSDQVQ